MVDTYSTILEFSLVDDFLRIVNKNDTFSFNNMVSANKDYVIIPASACSNDMGENIVNHKLNRSKVTFLKYYNESSTPEELSPAPFALIAQGATSGNQGIVVSVDSGTSPQITLGSVTQQLKAVFLCKKQNSTYSADELVVLAYCILPESVPVRNYIQLPSDGLVIEIDSVLNK